MKPTATADTTLLPDGSLPPPFPVLEPVPDDEPEPTFEAVPEGATLVYGSDEGTFMCDCGRIVRDLRALKAHQRTSRLHKEPVIA